MYIRIIIETDCNAFASRLLLTQANARRVRLTRTQQQHACVRRICSDGVFGPKRTNACRSPLRRNSCAYLLHQHSFNMIIDTNTNANLIEVKGEHSVVLFEHSIIQCMCFSKGGYRTLRLCQTQASDDRLL